MAKIHNQAFNSGANELNHQIIELAEIAVKTVPGATLEIQTKPGADQRTYKADFGKFARTFPDFRFIWNAASGANELYQAFKRVRLQHDDYVSPKFTRLKWLNHLMQTKRLNEALRWA